MNFEDSIEVNNRKVHTNSNISISQKQDTKPQNNSHYSVEKEVCIQNQNLDSSLESNTGNSSIFESQNIKNSTCLLPEIVANGKKNGISAYQTLREAGYICTDKETIFRQDVVVV